MPITLALHVDTQQTTLQFAADELRRFLDGIQIVADESADWSLNMQVDPDLPPYAFALNCAEHGKIVLSGHDATCALHAVYTWLEKLGWRFEVTGARRVQGVDLAEQFAKLVGWQTQIQPVVNQRGIRQHLNFPMDISSYPLDEALDYLRNLARLRFNHITFHSYGGQWYEVHHGDMDQLAGEYFYGQRHDLPDHPLLRRVIRNQRTYCIPEIEPIIDDRAANSRAAINWLQALIQEAKRIGLTIQFSFELRESDLALSLATVESILSDYPLIDVLEIITEETGVWASSVPANDLKAITREYFGEAALLLNHGNRAVAQNLRDLHLPREDCVRTLIYSWIEFDGTVYLFQNALTGIDQLMQVASEAMSGQPINGIALNHWRTAENRTCIHYAAETFLYGVLPRADFYREYAESLGIAHASDYTTAMNLLDDADTQARNDLPNVGFSFVGCWGSEGLGYYGEFEHAKVVSVVSKYAEALKLLCICAEATTNPDGLAYPTFLQNRVLATVIYLDAIDEATELQPICVGKTPDQLSGDARAAARTICDHALDLMEAYMQTHAEMIEDRGGEGTLISFYHTPPAVLKRIRAEYGSGQKLSEAVPQTFDAPPAPIAEVQS